jgi:hypothetical protein
VDLGGAKPLSIIVTKRPPLLMIRLFDWHTGQLTRPLHPWRTSLQHPLTSYLLFPIITVLLDTYTSILPSAVLSEILVHLGWKTTVHPCRLSLCRNPEEGVDVSYGHSDQGFGFPYEIPPRAPSRAPPDVKKDGAVLFNLVQHSPYAIRAESRGILAC